MPSSAELEETRARLHGFLLRRMGRGNPEATDLLQEVYVRFLQTPDHALIRQPMAYLYRIAANLLYDRRRREERETVVFDSQAADESAERPADVLRDELVESLNARQEIEHRLAELPGTYQAVLLLYKRDGLSCPEIAEKLRISQHTAEKYLYRAIAHFRRAHLASPGAQR